MPSGLCACESFETCVKRVADCRIPRFTNMSRKVFIYLVVCDIDISVGGGE